MRILIVKLSSIGDIVHTLPSIAALKRALPSSEISWVVEGRCAELLRNNRLIDRLIEVDTRALRRGDKMLGKTFETALGQFRELRGLGLDLSIDFQGLLKSATIARIAGAPKRYGFETSDLREPASRFLLTDRADVESDQNVVFKNIELAESALRDFLGDTAFELDRSSVEFPIETAATDQKDADKIISETGGSFAILNPGGGWVTKLWRPEDYGKLADLIRDRLGLTPVVSTGPGEEHLAEAVCTASSSGNVVTASLGLKGFFELARRASVYVGGDTGPTHLAVAAGCPVVGIFGPTEWWRNGSVVESDICVSREGLECRVDCHRRTCDKWICMDIPVQTVFEAVSGRIAASAQSDAGKAS